MSFGGQSNQWQRSNVGQLSSFQPQQMPMFLQQTPQQQTNMTFGNWPGSAEFVSYPHPRGPGLNRVAFQQTPAAGSSGPQAQHYNSIGTVTKINSGCGLVNDDVFFYRNVCKGHVPKLGDRVLFEATFSSTGQFKWNATRIQLMPQQIQPPPLMGSTAAIKGSSGYKAVPPPNEYQRAQQMQRHSSPSRRLSPNRDRHARSERERWDRKRNHRSKVRLSSGTGAGSSGCNATANTTSRMLTTSAANQEDSDVESVTSMNTAEGTKKRSRNKPSKEGLKAKSQYKAAVKICGRLESKSSLSKEDKERLAWAKDTVEKGRAHFATKAWCAASDPKFVNRVEENIVNKGQRSTENDAALSKKEKQNEEAVNLDQPITSKVAKAKGHLIVALVDRSNTLGQMSQEQWMAVEMKLLDAMIDKMKAEPSAPIPSFDGAGWFNGIKIINCNDDPTLKWVKGAVRTLQGLWEGASLEIVDHGSISSLPKAKVLIPRVVKPEDALCLLQRQNPDVPTSDWKILHVTQPSAADAGQSYVLQINKVAEDVLYARFDDLTVVVVEGGKDELILPASSYMPHDTDAPSIELYKLETLTGIKSECQCSPFIVGQQRREGKGFDWSNKKQPLLTHVGWF